MRLGDAWWIGLYRGIQQERAILDDWEKNLVGKGKSKQPATPHVRQLRVILDLLQEDNNYMAMDTIQFYLSRYSSPELYLYQLWDLQQYDAVANYLHEDLKFFDRRLPDGYDGSLMKEKVRAAVDERFLIEEDAETGKLVSWVYRG